MRALNHFQGKKVKLGPRRKARSVLNSSAINWQTGEGLGMAGKVVFQGVAGAYSELAALSYFGPGMQLTGLPEFADVFAQVSDRKAQYGIVPIENSLTGSIHQNFDLFIEHELWIVGEVKLRISHSLLAHPGKRIPELTRVYSHPQGLWQCQGFLRRYPRMEPTAAFDTAGSAKLIAEHKEYDAAAIASREAATRYGLVALKNGIEDNKKNFTRFLVLARKPSARGKSDGPVKTTLLFSLKNSPGSLYRSLGVFAERAIQVFKIESRPIPGRPWEYLFYLDVAGHASDKAVKQGLGELKEHVRQLRVLGSYPIAK